MTEDRSQKTDDRERMTEFGSRNHLNLEVGMRKGKEAEG
jgi:hypothetical protein